MLVCVYLLPVYIRPTPPSPTLHPPPSGRCNMERWSGIVSKFASVSLPSKQKPQPPLCWPHVASCLPLQHAAIVAAGGARVEGERSHVLPTDVHLHPFLWSDSCAICAPVFSLQSGDGQELCDIAYLTEAHRVSYHGNRALLTLRCLAPESCIKKKKTEQRCFWKGQRASDAKGSGLFLATKTSLDNTAKNPPCV